MTGGLDIDGGDLILNAATTGDVDIASTATLDLNDTLTGNLTNAGSTDLAGNITGSLTQSVGTTTVSGSSRVTGGLDIDGGDLILNAATTGDVDIASTATLDLNDTLTGSLTNAGDADIDAAITGSVSNASTLDLAGDITGSLTQSAGTTTVSGVSTVTGGLDITGGALILNAATTGDVDVASTATLDLNDTLTGNLTNVGDADIDATIDG
ncbi:hypothetical protein GFB49_20880, partial [Epibacterium sp. SM1979]|nr:hypothetical protein [Tritonibacter litoralis]